MTFVGLQKRNTSSTDQRVSSASCSSASKDSPGQATTETKDYQWITMFGDAVLTRLIQRVSDFLFAHYAYDKIFLFPFKYRSRSCGRSSGRFSPVSHCTSPGSFPGIPWGGQSGHV